jgi:hypothetical protein
MSYRDSLIQMNLDDATDVVFSYTTERDVWFTEDVNEEDTIVNQTDSFDVWWKIVNAPGFEQHLRNALLNAVEFMNIETESPEEIDLSRAYQAFKDNPYELFEDCECETIRYDHKRGYVRGVWEFPTEWETIRDNDQFWQIFDDAKGELEISVYTDDGVLTLAK